ncbi:MAG: AAA family ATPase, partial [Polyangiaceae bacterium]
RAARAALEIRDHCERRSNLMRTSIGWKIDVRFGMHQGRVTMDANQASTLSTTAMIASRLCQLATPGDIAVSQTAVGLLLGLRKFDQQPPDSVLGSLVWYQLSSELVDNVARSSAHDALTPFTVGRDIELAKLEGVWLGEAGFAARCVVIQGPAGMGKSHLSTVWQRGLAAKGCEILQARCLPETQGSALYPILRILRERVGLDDAEPAKASAVLARYLAEHGIDPEANMPLLCAWLGLDSTAWPDQPLSPKKKRDQLLALMVNLVARLVPAPSVLFIEDVHWADPTTLEWLSMLVDLEHDKRPLLACTLRTAQAAQDSAEPPSGVRQHHPGLNALLADQRTLIVDLDPLSDAASRQLLEGLWGAAEKTTLLVERGAGVPLFLLELVRCGVANRDFVVPPSIAEVLTLRIDQLGDAKETAQLAAVVGPEFDSALLSGLSQRGPELLGDLNRLQNAGIVTHLGDGRYSFSHALLHRSAYESLPGKDRRRLHGGVVSFLGERHPELQTSKPWLFALHHSGAGQFEQALTFGESAAAQAVVLFHNFEALSYVRELKGARPGVTGGWLGKLADPARQSRIELRLLALEATALMLTRGWSDLDLSRACERAEQLFPRVAEIETLQMRYVLAQFYFSSGWAANASGDDERAQPWIESLIRAATSTDTVVFRSLGLMMLSSWQFFQGKIASSIETSSRTERFPDSKDAWKFGYDAALCARSIEAQARWFRGDADAHEFNAETLRLAEAFGHPATLANVQLYSLTQLQLVGDRPGTLQRCLELLSLCERSGIQGFPAYALIFKGWAEGSPALAKGMFDALIGAGQRLCEVFCGTIVAEAVLDSGDAAAADELLSDLALRAISTGERFILPQILRLRARCVRAHDPRASERLLARASEIAIAQGAYGMDRLLTAERARLDAVG